MEKDSKTEIALIKALRRDGIILPQDSNDLECYNRKFKKDEIPPMPESLDNAEAILSRGVITKTYASEVNDQTTDDMARAAREGKSIPDSILKKMKEDRNNSKSND